MEKEWINEIKEKIFGMFREYELRYKDAKAVLLAVQWELAGLPDKNTPEKYKNPKI